MGNPLHYNNKYKNYDELMAKIEDDLSTYADQGFIESDKYIDVVDKCNAFLSVKINPTRTRKLEVSNYKVRLPDNFKLWCRGFICHGTTRTIPIKTTTEEKITTSKRDCNECPTCNECEETCEHITVTTEENEIVTTEQQVPLVLTHPHFSCSECDESSRNNRLHMCEVSIKKEKDGLYLLTGFESATLILEYVTEMVSSEDIVVYDHPLVREYYEYAIKERIFEDIWLNGKEEVFKRYQLAVEKHRQSKIEAKRFVNTPDFNELRSYYNTKRRKMYNKYYKPFLETRDPMLIFNNHNGHPHGYVYPSYYMHHNRTH